MARYGRAGRLRKMDEEAVLALAEKIKERRRDARHLEWMVRHEADVAERERICDCGKGRADPSLHRDGDAANPKPCPAWMPF